MSNLSTLAWNKVDWKKIESRVFRIQRRIYKAKTEKKINTIHYLQKKLINSLDGKLLSIREATRIKEFYCIKTIYFNRRKRKVKIIHTSQIKKRDKRLKVINKRNCDLFSSFITKNQIKDEATQFLIRLSIEPEWASKFEVNSMGHQLGQTYQDTIENIFSKQKLNIKYVFQTTLFENSTNFNTIRFLKKLNTIKIIEIQIKKWLDFNIINHFKRKKIYFYNDFEQKYRNPIMSILCDIGLHGLETYLSQLIKNKTKKGKKIHYYRYLNQILITSDNKKLLTQTALTCKQYLNEVGLQVNSKKQDILKNTINFLGFQLLILEKENTFQKKILIAKDSKKLILAKTRFVIQKNKAISAYFLIKKLEPIIFGWGRYFHYSDCAKDFVDIDNKILNQLRAWVFRRKAQGKNRTFLKEKYFPNGRIFTYQGHLYKNNWVLYGTLKNQGTYKNNFLPKLYWIEKKKYISVKNNYSIYNGDYFYWYKRLTQVEVDQKKLLQTMFLSQGKIEIYNLFTTITYCNR